MFDKLNNKYMIFFDWILAIGTLLYAVYLISSSGYSGYNIAMLIFGILACVMAYYRPANIMKGVLKRSLVKRK